MEWQLRGQLTNTLLFLTSKIRTKNCNGLLAGVGPIEGVERPDDDAQVSSVARFSGLGRTAVTEPHGDSLPRLSVLFLVHELQVVPHEARGGMHAYRQRS